MEEVWKELSLSSLHHFSPYTTTTTTTTTAAVHHSQNLHDFLDCPIPRTDPPARNEFRDVSYGRPPHPATALSLSTGSIRLSPNHPISGKKRGSGELLIDSSNDERRTRLMKNRESADRSRARKQAYTNELEKEVARLKKENAKLRRQLEMCCSSGHPQLPKEHILQRTLTAPF